MCHQVQEVTAPPGGSMRTTEFYVTYLMLWGCVTVFFSELFIKIEHTHTHTYTHTYSFISLLSCASDTVNRVKLAKITNNINKVKHVKVSKKCQYGYHCTCKWQWESYYSIRTKKSRSVL